MSDYDVVIVGAGVVGAMLGNRLGNAGKRVLILEAGSATAATWADYQANVERYQSSYIRVPNSPYLSPANAQSPSVLDIVKLQAEGPPSDTGYFVQEGPLPFSSDYFRGRGGTTLHWLGTCLRMLDADFSMQSTYGVGVDWPVDREDLSGVVNNFYEQAERELAVSAEVADQGYCGQEFPRGYDYPMKRIPLSWNDQRHAELLNGKPVNLDGTTYDLLVSATPQSRNSTPNADYVDPVTGASGYSAVGAAGAPHEGLRCEGNSSCIPICPVQAKWNAGKALATLPDTVEIRTQSVASKVLLSSDRKTVTGIEYIAYDGGPVPDPPQVVTADLYVLGGHCVENAKLLLMSDAANSSDQVGRNLMDHPYQIAWALMPENVGAFRGPSSTSGFEFLRDGAFRKDRAAWRCEIANWGWDFAAFSPESDVETAVDRGLFGADLRAHLADFVPRQTHLGFLHEQLPRPDNRVTIDGRYLDPLGLPRPVISYDLDSYTRAGMAAAREFSKQVFAGLGAVDYTSYNTFDPGYVTHNGGGYTYHGAGHYVGTHRMGASPYESVVDPYQRSWDHENLYVAGCGSMPTIGTSNPTLTMVALTLRTAQSMLADFGIHG
jgi:choline dehydrogenase-like flavoprotein